MRQELLDALEEFKGGPGRPPKLRDYQLDAVNAAMAHARESELPGLIVAATGAGKSHIVAALALQLHIETGKKVVCIQPRGELVRQNFAKLVGAFGPFAPASVYAASVGRKDPTGPIVYTMPQTAKGGIAALAGAGAVIIDEAHGITPTIVELLDELREHCPSLIVIGLTATPYRLGEGYIYAIDADGTHTKPEECKEPFFGRVVYRIEAPELISRGMLTEPAIGQTGAEVYDTSGLSVKRAGRFDEKEVREVFVGRGRKTSKIVADFVERARHLKKGIVFAATIEHGHEIMESLPVGSAVLVTGKMTATDRAQALADYSAGRYKWVVNVDILTTGFDEPSIDHAVFLRATESAGLFQQMIGRVLRLHPGKPEALVFDYAGNLGRFFGASPDARDLFDPKVTKSGGGDGERISVHCPECAEINEVTLKSDWAQFPIDAQGYVVSTMTPEGEPPERLLDEYGKYIPAHHSRRCYAFHERQGALVRCGGWWVWRDCACGAKNDIASRRCSTCGEELVDPNKKLTLRGRYAPRDSWRVQRVGSYTSTDRVSKTGRKFLIVHFPGVGADFWIPAEPLHQAQERQKMLFEHRPEGADAIAWRMPDSGSNFPDFGGWYRSRDCPACEGSGVEDLYTQAGPKSSYCARCRGTGVLAHREDS